MQDFKTLEVRIIQLRDLLGGFSGPGDLAVLEKLAHHFQVPTALGQGFNEMVDLLRVLVGLDEDIGQQNEYRD